MWVFVDFDGVLRRISSAPNAFDADCLEHFEATIRKYAAVRIAISSSWRRVEALGVLRGYFSDDIGARILGVTPEALDDEPHVRYREIREYLRLRDELDTPWVAIDDYADHFPQNAPLLLVDSNRGFDARCAGRLSRMLEVCVGTASGIARAWQ